MPEKLQSIFLIPDLLINCVLFVANFSLAQGLLGGINVAAQNLSIPAFASIPLTLSHTADTKLGGKLFTKDSQSSESDLISN